MSRIDIDETLTEELQTLSKIRLKGDEMNRVKEDFAQILEYIDILGECDTSAVADTFVSDPITGGLREDIVSEDRKINPCGTTISVPEVL